MELWRAPFLPSLIMTCIGMVSIKSDCTWGDFYYVILTNKGERKIQLNPRKEGQRAFIMEPYCFKWLLLPERRPWAELTHWQTVRDGGEVARRQARQTQRVTVFPRMHETSATSL